MATSDCFQLGQIGSVPFKVTIVTDTMSNIDGTGTVMPRVNTSYQYERGKNYLPVSFNSTNSEAVKYNTLCYDNKNRRNKKAFQLNANRPLANITGCIVNKFEHVWGSRLRPCIEGWGETPELGVGWRMTRAF